LAIVDDHELTRQSLQNMLSNEPDIEIVGEAANGRQALSLCSRFRPDLILMMLTMHENPDYLLGALKAGAAGYILKDASHEEIIEAVRRVRNGESPLDPELAARLLRRLASEGEARRGTGGPHAAPNAVEPLTPRELEVLGLMKLGRTNREIAGDLIISLGTAKNHVEHIISKLGVSDRTRAVVQGLELGLIDLP
jgi:DNA-binding NarL/FixJ family response regulator